MRGLDFLQWMNMLKEVFNASLCVLRRMKVSCKHINYQPVFKGEVCTA